MIELTYSESQKKRIAYILRKLAGLPKGHTPSPQTLDGYPFISHINRYGHPTSEHSQKIEKYIKELFKKNPEYKNKIDLIEQAWQHYFVYGTPNGDLFKHNEMLNSIKEGKGLDLLHITTNYKEILKSKQIYQSSGSLGATVYCTPVGPNNRISNLAKYIYEKEFYLSKCKTVKKKDIKMILIHIDQENFIDADPNLYGIDYLKLGSVQLDLYETFKIINKDSYYDEFDLLEKRILQSIKKDSEFLNICAEYKMDKISDDDFINKFEETINSFPILGYIYFEVLSEYISLFQDDAVSNYFHELGELNNFNYKNLVYELCSDLNEGFRLTKFRPSIKTVVEYLQNKSKENKVITNFQIKHFIHFFKWRTAQYIRSRLLDCKKLSNNFTIEVIKKRNPSLFGHIIRQEVRDAFGEDLTQMFFRFRAYKYWEYWNRTKTLIPYTSIIPKGEIGINVLFPHLQYSIYEAKLNADGYTIEKGKRLNVKLKPELISSKMSNLRKV